LRYIFVFAAMLVGVLVMGIFASVHFGRVRREGLF
jgi:hypothetical protein